MRVIIHCFSLTDRVEECVERGWFCSFAGNVTYPKATDLQRGGGRGSPTSCCWSRPTRRSFRRRSAAASRTSRPTWARPPRFLAELRGTRYEEMERLLDANAARLFGW